MPRIPKEVAAILKDRAQHHSEPQSSTANSAENKTDPSPWLAPYRFQPGQSGNPNGRPKETDLAKKATPDYVIGAIYELVDNARRSAKPDPYAILKGLELLGRYNALFTDKLETKVKQVPAGTLDEQIKQLEQELGLAKVIDDVSSDSSDQDGIPGQDVAFDGVKA